MFAGFVQSAILRFLSCVRCGGMPGTAIYSILGLVDKNRGIEHSIIFIVSRNFLKGKNHPIRKKVSHT